MTDKHSLLPAAELAQLEALTRDQQALVDYEVMVRCDVFGGFAKSSFSFNVAVVRGLVMQDAGRVVEQ